MGTRGQVLRSADGREKQGKDIGDSHSWLQLLQIEQVLQVTLQRIILRLEKEFFIEKVEEVKYVCQRCCNLLVGRNF